MHRRSVLAVTVLTAGIALLLGGCSASHQARSVELKETLLVNPALLQKGGDEQALYRYVNPKTVANKYSKIMIDPVLVSKTADMSAEETEDYQKLANNAFVYLSDALKKDWPVVSKPEPGTIRVQMAIIAADSSKPVRNLLATVLPVGAAISAVKYAATGKPSAVGEITVEMEFTDAVSNEILGAALDKRVGGMNIQGTWDSWLTADDALNYWAKRTAYVLCDARGGKGCVKP